jgi:hypothetical protein
VGFATPLNYWGNYNDLRTRLLEIFQLCSCTIVHLCSETFPNCQSEIGLGPCLNPLANAMQENAEEPMIPEALNILNRSEEYLKERKTKKKHSKE